MRSSDKPICLALQMLFLTKKNTLCLLRRNHGRSEQNVYSVYFMLSICNTTNDSFRLHMIIPFPVLISHIYFWLWVVKKRMFCQEKDATTKVKFWYQGIWRPQWEYLNISNLDITHYPCTFGQIWAHFH